MNKDVIPAYLDALRRHRACVVNAVGCSHKKFRADKGPCAASLIVYFKFHHKREAFLFHPIMDFKQAGTMGALDAVANDGSGQKNSGKP